MAGLLGMGGLGGSFGGGAPAGLLKGDLAALFNPTSMRNSQIKKGLLQAGLTMMNPDPRAPPAGIGGILGRAASGGIQGADQAKQEFMQDGMMNVQLQQMQREQDSRTAQDEAMAALIPTLPPEIQSFAKAYPQQFGEAYLKAKMAGGEGYSLGPGQVRFGPDNKPIAVGPPRDEGEGRGFIQEQKLRKEYIDQQKPFEDLRAMYQRMIAGYEGAANDQTGASDIALVFSYMKMLDPTSVVREGEQATAQNAAGIPDQIRMMWNKVISGQRLPQEVRDAFMDQATRQYEQQLGSYGQSREGYQGLAGQYPDVDPGRVAPDLTYGVKPYKRSNISPDAIDAELRRRGVIQ